MFAGCGSPWKKPCRKIIVIHVSVDQVREAAPLLERVRSSVDVGELHALEELERQHAGARVAPVDARDRGRAGGRRSCGGSGSALRASSR